MIEADIHTTLIEIISMLLPRAFSTRERWNSVDLQFRYCMVSAPH